MSGISKPLVAAAVALALSSSPVRAQLWYNGNWNGTTFLANERDNWVADSRIYDNFLVGTSGWQVTTLFGDFLSSLTPTQGYWEIRSGVSTGNGGTVLHSGVSPLSWAIYGAGGFGYNQYRATITGLDLLLSEGMYWMVLAPIQAANGRAFLNGTSGTGGVNALLDGNSYWDSQTFKKNFVPTASYFGLEVDFAYGIAGYFPPPPVQLTVQPEDELPGTLVTPEPGAFLLTATGLGFVAVALRRRRRAAA